MARDITVKITLDDQLSSAFSKVANNLTTQAQSAGKAAASAFSGATSAATSALDGAAAKIGSSFSGIAGKAASAANAVKSSFVGMSTAAVALGGSLLAVGSQFEAVYKNLALRTGATGAEFEKLKNDLKAVVGTSAADMTLVGDVMAQVAQRTGATGTQLQNLTKQIISLSSATGSDAVQSVGTVTRMFGDWGVATGDQQKALDALYVASTKSGVGIDELSRLTVQFGAPLRNFGFSMNQGIGMLALWQKQGVNTELVMGSLRIAAGKLAKDGIDLKTGLFQAVDAIKKAGSSSEATAMAMQLFGARAGADMADTIRGGKFEIEDFVKALDNSPGALAKVREETKSFTSYLKQFKNQLMVAIEPAGMAFVALATAVTKALAPAVDWLAKGITAVATPIGAFVKGLASLPGPILAIASLIVGGVGSFGLLSKVLAFLPGPISAVATSLMAALGPFAMLIPLAGALAVAWSSNFMGIRDAVTGALAPLMPLFETFKAGMQAFSDMFSGQMANGAGFFTALAAGMQSLASTMSSTPLGPMFQAIADAVTLIQPLFMQFVAVIQSALAPAFTALSGIVPVITQLLTTMATALGQLFSGDIAGGITTLLTGFLNFQTGLAGVMANVGAALLTAVAGFAQTLGGWVMAAIPYVMQGLLTFGSALVTGIQTALPLLLQGTATLVSGLVDWIVAAVPMAVSALATFAAGLFSAIVTYTPVIAAQVLQWAGALLSFLNGSQGMLATGFSALMGWIANFITTGVPAIIAQVASWATALAAWIPGAIGQLASGLGSLVGNVLSFIVGAVPGIAGALLSWIATLAEFALKAIPGAISAIGQLVTTLVGWVFSEGLPMLINAAIQLASGLVKGFLGALTGQGGQITGAMAKIGGDGPKAMETASRSPWQSMIAGMRSNGQRAADSAEEGFLNGAVRAGRNGAEAIAQGVRDGTPSIKNAAAAAGAAAGGTAAGAAGMPGGGGGGGKGGGAEKGAKGAAGAAADPAQAAMQAVQNTASMISSGLDAIEKMFSFRGLPPPDIMDAVFNALKEIMNRSMSLAGGITAEAAQAKAAAAQMIQAFTQALIGMVDLAEKLARFRVPAMPQMDALLALGKQIILIAQKLVADMGKADLAKSLEQSAISQKTAEMLKAWVDTLKGMAEATQALAKGRWQIDMGKPEAFLLEIARFGLWVMEWFKYNFPKSNMRLMLMDSKDFAEMLKPWIDNMKGIAEASQAMSKGRWQIDMSKPEGFLTDLANFALNMLATLRKQLTYNLLLALDDTKLLGETLKPWIELLKGAAEAAGAISKVTFPSDLSGVSAFITRLATAIITVTGDMEKMLKGDILVVLEDSKTIAETLSAWMGPLKEIGAVVASVGKAQIGTSLAGVGAFFLSLWAEVTQLHGFLAVSLKNDLLVVLEDSKTIAETMNAWMAPLKELGNVALALDTLRMMAHKRWDNTLTAMWDMLAGIAVMTGRFVATGEGAFKSNLLAALETSKSIAEAFKAWIEPLSKMGDVATSAEKVRGLAQTRWDTTMNAMWNFMVEIAKATGKFVDGAKALGGETLRALDMSEQIAKTFGAWMDPLSKMADAAQSIDVVRRLSQERWDNTMGALVTMFNAIGVTSYAVVEAVMRSADPKAQLEVSQEVAKTFGAWLDIMTKMGEATRAIAKVKSIDSSVLEDIVRMMATIAGASNSIVQAVQRAADPKAQLEVSAQVAATFNAWVEGFKNVAEASDKLAGMVDVPTAAIEAALNLMVRIAASTAPIVAAVSRAADPKGALEASKAVAETFKAWVEGFSAAADLSEKLVGIEPVKPQELAVVEGLIQQTFDVLKRMGADLVAMEEEARTNFLAGIKGFAEVAKEAIDLFASAASLDFRDVVPLDPQGLDRARAAIAGVFTQLVSLADDLMPKVRSVAERLAGRVGAFTDVAGKAVSLFTSAAELGEKMNGAVAPTPRAMTAVRTTIRAVVTVVEQLASDWAEGRDRMSESVGVIDGFSKAATASLAVIGPAVDAMTKLADGPPKLMRSSLGRVRVAIVAIVGVIDGIAQGYKDAWGRLDETRTGAIEGFAKAASESAGAITKVVETLTALDEAQGRMGGLTKAVKATLSAAVTDMVSMFSDLATGFGMADAMNAKGMERAVAFAKNVSDLAGAIKSITDSVSGVWEAFHEKDDKTGKVKDKAIGFTENMRITLVNAIEQMATGLASVLDSVTKDAMNRAKWVADRVKPVAEAVGSMTEPIQKLVENPLVDAKSRTAWSAKAAQTRIKQLADNISKGIKTMAEVLIAGLKGVKVPTGAGNGVSALVNTVNSLMDAIERAMEGPEIDFGRLDDLKRAAAILSTIVPAAAMAASGTGGGVGGNSGAGPGIGSSTPIYDASGASSTSSVPMPGMNAGVPPIVTGPITAIGPVTWQGNLSIPLSLDGSVLQKVQQSGSWQAGTERSASGASPV